MAAKRKKGPDSVPEMHLRNPKRARNDNGKNEQDLQPSFTLIKPDIFDME